MKKNNLILVESLCNHYEVELSVFWSLNDVGLIQIETIDDAAFIPETKLSDLDKIVRLHTELNLNWEAIDVVFNLLHQVDDLQIALKSVRQKLETYQKQEEVKKRLNTL
jgi:hypothetical protein